MNSYAEVVVLVEGQTELGFVKQVLAPYMSERNVFLSPIILTKPGQKGGDVKFARAKNDIGDHLKQRSDTWVTLLVDYYAIKKDWPGYSESKQQRDHTQKAKKMNKATAMEVQELFSKHNKGTRFIPYVSMHELEALYFSDPCCLARKLGINQNRIDAILDECMEPENINDKIETAPSKRLEKLSKRFRKTSSGIDIAKEIGIKKMRKACPLFNYWLTELEALAQCEDSEL